MEFSNNNDLLNYGDFGSYKFVNKKNILSKDSLIYSHGAVDVKGLEKFFRIIQKLILIKNNLDFSSVIDVGSGLGFLTHAIQRVTKVSAYGLEISKDATEFSSRKFKKCTFINGAVDPNNDNCPFRVLLSSLGSSIVLASEFYPFTRTANLEIHHKFLDHFFSSSKIQGVVMISSFKYIKDIHNCETFFSSISQWNKWGYSVSNYCLPNLKICKYAPKILSRSYLN